MVYNSWARAWIHELQKIFHTCQISPFSSEDIRLASKFIEHLMVHYPFFAEKFSQMGLTTINNKSRFADSFLHCRELYASPTYWLNSIEQSGFRIMGLFDRYAELDDLANPLWQTPKPQQLIDRCKDKRFENNLELFLCKKNDAPPEQNELAAAKPLGRIPSNLKFASPPSSWFDYQETKKLPTSLKWQLWQDHIRYCWLGTDSPRSQRLERLPISTLQRLARIGAIFPGMLTSQKLITEVSKPMEDFMQKPNVPKFKNADNALTKAFFQEMLQNKRLKNTQRVLAVTLDRINKAQRS